MIIPLSGSLLISQFKKTIYTWIQVQTNGVISRDQIIWRNQSEPLPGRPCVTMKITDGPTRDGYQDGRFFLGGLSGSQFLIGGTRSMTVSIQVFGSLTLHEPIAYQLALDLNASLNRMTVLDQLRQGGVSILKQGSVNNLTAVEETAFEERAGFDISCGVSENILDDPGIITTVTNVGFVPT